jgi:DNA-binding transcriptional MerR regulator
MNQAVESMSISELAEAAGVTPRTIRFYVAEGLLPPPGGAGVNREYTGEHLLRLRAIRRLKDAYLPLGEIRRRLPSMSLDELRAIAEQPEPPPPATALEYLAGVMPPIRPRQAERSMAAPPAGATPPPIAPAPAAAPMRSSAPPSSEWQRIELAPGIELHARVSRNPARNAAISSLAVAIAQRLTSLPPEDSGDVRS